MKTWPTAPSPSATPTPPPENPCPTPTLLWTIRDGSDGDTPSWTRGSLDQLVSVIRLAPAQLGNPDFAAAAPFPTAWMRRLTGWMTLKSRRWPLPWTCPAKTKDGRPVREPWNAPRQARPSGNRHRRHVPLPPRQPIWPVCAPKLTTATGQPFTGDWPPTGAHLCADPRQPHRRFPGFLGPDSGSGLQAYLRDRAGRPVGLAANPVLHRGRQRHRQSCPGRFRQHRRYAPRPAGPHLPYRPGHRPLWTGSFYTTTAAATLLAALAITDDMCDWNDAQAIGSLRITDPACGHGNLVNGRRRAHPRTCAPSRCRKRLGPVPYRTSALRL